MNEKYNALTEYIKSLGSLAVAFSGGVDSTFLLKAAHDVLGDGCAAVTARSCLFPQSETDEAAEFCKKEGIRQITVDFEPFGVEGFSNNPENRCYLCKTALFTKIRAEAAKLGIEHIAEGSNVDDTGDYRPGLAAVEELGIKSPLRRANLTKSEIRALSEQMGLDTWNKPSYACLASRFVYGETITEDKLGMVGEAERFLRGMGFLQSRVRIHGMMARIEILKEDFPKMLGVYGKVHDRLKSLGFTYVSLDLGGYRTGSMNETIGK